MEVRPSVSGVAGTRGARLTAAVVAALALLAYRPLLAGALHVPGAPELEGWLFRPSPLPPLLVLVVSGWLLWRRRARLRAAQGGPAPAVAIPLAALGTGLYLWAVLTRTIDLFLPSLAAGGLALAAASRGAAGVRAAGLPAAVLLLGMQIPAPLQDEIVWHLQLWTASGAAWLLRAMGHDLVHGGVVLTTAEHSFHVIDGCSGYSGIQILLLVSFIVRDLFAEAGGRAWIVVALAVPVGFALNVVRIAGVASSANPEALAGLEGDHTPQGVALLALGSGLLYAVGALLARGATRGAGYAASDPSGSAPREAPWRVAAAGLAALAAVSILLPPFQADASRDRSPIAFPEEGAGWTSEALVPNPFFIGAGLTRDESFHRRYRKRGTPADSLSAVEVFVGAESARRPLSSRFLSSKLSRPGPEWTVEERERQRIWVLDREAERVVASLPPGGEHAVLYVWRLGDAGLWAESWRSLLALSSSPLRRAQPRRVVQLVAYAPHDGQLALDRAKQRLDQFVLDFREELAAL